MRWTSQIVLRPRPSSSSSILGLAFSRTRPSPAASPSVPAWLSSGGYTLIECLVYIAALLVIMELAFAAYYRFELHNRRLTRNATDIVRALQAGERWRDDVRAAKGKLFWTEAGADRELRIPQARGEVAYAFRQGAVWRRAAAVGPWNEFLPAVKASRMEAEPRTHVTAWRWELELQTTRDEVRVTPLFTFLAVAQKPPEP